MMAGTGVCSVYLRTTSNGYSSYDCAIRALGFDRRLCLCLDVWTVNLPQVWNLREVVLGKQEAPGGFLMNTPSVHTRR